MYAIRHKLTKSVLQSLFIGSDKHMFVTIGGDGVWVDTSLQFVREVMDGQHRDAENVPEFSDVIKASDCEVVQLGVVAVL